MIIKSIEIDKFRAMENITLKLGRNLTAIAGRNATLKTTLLGIIGQPFTISKGHPMFGCKTIDGYNFKSQFKEKFKLSKVHDKTGEHKWKLKLHNKGYYADDEINMVSIPRPTKSNPNEIRFWNAKSKSKGSGYIQLPVYYLSLSRLFPIGESEKTKKINIDLTPIESEYFLKYYRSILSIQNENDNSSVHMEKSISSKVFIGVNDASHDIFTNSAGESNIGRIILAVLSFKRLKENYKNSYKGGILLVDEIDATLYGYSQKKLIDFLQVASKEFNLQIIFTTHSPLILQQVNKYQREERKYISSDIDLDSYTYNNTIIYLEPIYDEDGKRMINGKNINSATDLNQVINNINLTANITRQSINVYLEDRRAKDFLVFLLKKNMKFNYENYINIIDVDLGWTNYIQLHKKQIPEFLNSIILLDNDVKENREALRYIKLSTNNIILLPIDIEAGLFKLLKSHQIYIEFERKINPTIMSYDICFRDWTEKEYDSNEYKKWFKYMEETLGGIDVLFEFWYSLNTDLAEEFVNNFINVYNLIADRLELDNITLNL